MKFYWFKDMLFGLGAVIATSAKNFVAITSPTSKHARASTGTIQRHLQKHLTELLNHKSKRDQHASH